MTRITRRMSLGVLTAPAVLRPDEASAVFAGSPLQPTLDEITDFNARKYFVAAPTGQLRLYQRIATAPFYEDMGDAAAPVARVDLAAPDTASQIGFQAAGKDALARTTESKLRENVTLGDKAGDAADSARQIVAEVKSEGGGFFSAGIEIPVLRRSKPIKIIGGVGGTLGAIGFDGRYRQVRSPDAATNAFEFGNEAGNIAATWRNEYSIQHLSAVGTGKGGNCIGILLKEAANIRLGGGFLSGFGTGIQGHGALSSSIQGYTVTACKYGLCLEPGDGALLGGAPNAFSIAFSCFYGNERAVKHSGAANGSTLWLSDNFEGNNLSGKPDDGSAVIELAGAGQQVFVSTHHEGNAGEFGILYQGADSEKTMSIIGSEMIDGTATLVQIAQGSLLALGSRIFSQAAQRDIHLAAGTSATLINTATRPPSGSTARLIGIRNGKLGFGFNPNPGSPCIYASPEAVANEPSSRFSIISSDFTQHEYQDAEGARIGYVSFGKAQDHCFVSSNANRGWSWWINTSVRVLFVGRRGANAIEPGTLGVSTLGTGAAPWREVFSTSGPVTTSDLRLKRWRGEMTAAEKAAALEIISLMGFYQWRDSIDRKGIVDARLHFGLPAQEVWAIMARHRLVDELREGREPSSRYAALCWDRWDACPDSAAGRGDDSEDIVVTQGDKFSLRTDQLVMWIVAADHLENRQRREALERRLAALEERAGRQ